MEKDKLFPVHCGHPTTKKRHSTGWASLDLGDNVLILQPIYWVTWEAAIFEQSPRVKEGSAMGPCYGTSTWEVRPSISHGARNIHGR